MLASIANVAAVSFVVEKPHGLVLRTGLWLFELHYGSKLRTRYDIVLENPAYQGTLGIKFMRTLFSGLQAKRIWHLG